MPETFDYTTGTNSENVRLLQALIDDAPEYTEETNSRNANILKSIINNTEYTDAPQSEIEELLLRLKAKIGGEIEVDELNVTENGTYDAGVNKAYNPVKVELPLSSKTITENGTYTASDDSLAGYDEVTVNVPTPPDSYQLKSLPTGAISTIEDGTALPMPSLKVGIEAVQSGTGDPSPTNVRPISGWSAVDVVVSPTTDVEDGTTYTTTLKDGQGNPLVCYGGQLVNENGVQSLAVERVSEVFDGSNDEMWISDSNMTSEDGIVCFRAYLQNNNIKKPEGTASSINYIGKMFANIMPTLKNGYVNQYPMANTVMGITGYSGTDGNYFYINVNKTLSNIQSVADLRAWLAENPTTVVYELATPTQTPQDNLAIATQDGTNNLWADTGDVLEGSYFKEL